jgi:hypothetical protein
VRRDRGVLREVSLKQCFPIGFAIILATLFGACSKRDDLNGWGKYTSQEGGFYVMAPGKPFQKTVGTNFFTLHQFFFETGKTDSCYLVSYGNVSTIDKRTTDQIYDDVGDGIIRKYGKPSQEWNATISGFPGREMKMIVDNGDGFVDMRYFIAKGRLYQTLVMGPRAEQPSTNISYFLDSFNLIDQ